MGGSVRDHRKVQFEDRSLADVNIDGITPEVLQMVDTRLSEGRLLNGSDEEHHRRVAFIGMEIKKQLFPTLDPIGREIKIAGTAYTIIGLAEEKGSFLGNNMDNFVYLPLTTFERQFGATGPWTSSCRWRTYR